MRCAVQDNCIHVLIWFRLTVAIDVFDLDGGVIHENADGQGQSAQRHDVDGFAERAESDDRCQNGERNRNHNNGRAPPTAEKDKDH